MNEAPNGPAWSVVEVDDAKVQALKDSTGVSQVVARLLVGRGIDTQESAQRFLHPDLERDWRDPESLPGLPDAADAVADAVRTGERICVFGDFDADGITAAAALFLALRSFGSEPVAVLPHRFREGYGLTPGVLPRISDAAPGLVITVDCGISAAPEVETLLSSGIRVVITDHHEPGDEVPKGVPVCDPKLDPAYPFQGLAGVGVALKLAQAVGDRLGIGSAHSHLADLGMIGTVADIVPLLDENRALVSAGIALTASEPRPGVAALLEVAKVDPAALTSTSVAFAVAPRINAAGRLADPMIAFELLTTEDPDRARELARELDGLNRSRKSVEQELLDQAVGQADAQIEQGRSVLVVAGEGWHEGVRGIVASRLSRLHGLPTLVFTLDGGVASGSGRSVPGLDLFSTVSSLDVTLERFGGHAQAVGLTLAEADLTDLAAALHEAVVHTDLQAPVPTVDAEISLDDIGPDLVASLGLLEPFGQGNPRPRFGSRGVFMHGRKRVGAAADHLLFDAYDGVASIPAAAFRCPEIEDVAVHESPVEVVFEVERDEWRGRSRTRMLVREILRTPESTEAPAATLVEDLFAAAPAILAREEYSGIGDAESFHTKLAGVTFEGRQDVVSDLAPGTPLRLERQPENPFDPAACALFGPDGRQAGFFNRRLAAVLAPLLDDGLELDVTVEQVTGGVDDKALGVNVLVERRKRSDESAGEDGIELREEMVALADSSLDDALVQHFIGDGVLHDAQRRSLEYLASGEDCLTVMATGRGKSLIFHIHAVREAIKKGRASVFVYPLRALVSDQAFHLDEKLSGIGVACRTVTGETGMSARDEAFSELADGSLDVILTTPEFLDRHADRFAATGRVGFLVIDEAHHVGLARAGHRPAYGRLGEVLERLGSPQVLAVTATAGDDVAQTVVSTLGLDQVVTDPTVRENLRIADRRNEGDKVANIASVAATGEKVVVYVNSREKSVKIASQIRQKVPALRHRVAFYNGGLTRTARHAVERAFRSGDLTAIVATSAFGEGVDISDIRHVFHFHMPFNEVEFNQMSGRAGRDGAPATVHLSFGAKDVRLNELVLQSVAPSRDDMAQLYLVLKGLAQEHPDGFEITNAELAEDVVARRRGSKMTDRGVSSSLGVFRELGFVEGEGAGSYRRLRLLPAPDGKLDLGTSVRYAEGLEELETFRAFKEWALDAAPQDLLDRFNRPILPTRYA